MLDFFHLPGAQGGAETTVFIGLPPLINQAPMTWTRPRGKSMIHIQLIGAGGDGGAGVIGAVSTAAGGGGGGSGSICRVIIPADNLPDTLFIRFGGSAAGSSYVLATPDYNAAPNAFGVVAKANRGGAGGAASGATGGTAGGAGNAPVNSDMLLGWTYATVLAGSAGTAGGTTAAGTALNIGTSGLYLTGGTGGAGLGNAGSTGSAGGAINGSGFLPTHPGGTAAGASTTRPGDGAAGIQPLNKVFFFYGGTGGGSTAGNATGAGLVQASGGNGAPGCGGGGSGGALTGSTAGTPGQGGPSFCIITCW